MATYWLLGEKPSEADPKAAAPELTSGLASNQNQLLPASMSANTPSIVSEMVEDASHNGTSFKIEEEVEHKKAETMPLLAAATSGNGSTHQV